MKFFHVEVLRVGAITGKADDDKFYSRCLISPSKTENMNSTKLRIKGLFFSGKGAKIKIRFKTIALSEFYWLIL